MCGVPVLLEDGSGAATAHRIKQFGITRPPKIGENSDLMLRIALLFISGSAVIGTTVVSKKKKHNS